MQILFWVAVTYSRLAIKTKASPIWNNQIKQLHEVCLKIEVPNQNTCKICAIIYTSFYLLFVEFMRQSSVHSLVLSAGTTIKINLGCFQI